MFAAIVLGAAVFLGYQMAPRGGDIARLDTATELWQRQAADQRQAIATLRLRLEDNIQVLTRHLGRLQAQVTRLNAVGVRMTKLAGLSGDEFDFGNPPPMGGPQAVEDESLPSLGQLKEQINALASRLDSRERQMQVLRDLLVAGEVRKQVTPSGSPTLTGWISSVFGWRVDPFTGRRGFHEGIDFAAPLGSKVLAAAAGVVSFAGHMQGYGNLVEINHGNGYVTRYGHCKKILVHVGQRVDKGEVVAKVGSTGRSTGPHVHFEVRRNGKVVNPASYIQAAR
ncbi:MAG: M23 family metallopeptidase [Salinisphaera sp.]|nr:M23 family metallopeptidase [Salinisphaera sp.]